MSPANLFETINDILLRQDFASPVADDGLEGLKKSLREYVRIENCVAVLSDFKADKSYIFSGSFGALFGITTSEAGIESAFEDFIFDKIHPEDVNMRHQLELRYIELQQNTPPDERANYNTSCLVRVLSPDGTHRYISHQMRYPVSLPDGSIWLALCLYAPTSGQPEPGTIDARIYDCITGNVVEHVAMGHENPPAALLSRREGEILQCMANGEASKNIADSLRISINTVNRHRQNILAKMNASNTMDAVNKAAMMGIIRR